jgi:hypothetical protein
MENWRPDFKGAYNNDDMLFCLQDVFIRNSLGCIMAVGKACFFSVVLPLHAHVFGLCCISTKPAISGFPMIPNISNDLKNNPAPQAPTVPYTAI